jgi:hypothetical protein
MPTSLARGVKLLTDAVRGIEAQPGDVERALEEMRDAGVELVTAEDLTS